MNCFLCHKLFERNESTERVAGESKDCRCCRQCSKEWNIALEPVQLDLVSWINNQ